MDLALNELTKIETQIANVKYFEELFDLIRNQLKSIKGLGELYICDTALRIGAYKKLYPMRIYLHAVTRKGARALELDYKADYLYLPSCPPEFMDLEPHEVEDVLCIFKDKFKSNKKTENEEIIKKSWCY